MSRRPTTEKIASRAGMMTAMAYESREFTCRLASAVNCAPALPALAPDPDGPVAPPAGGDRARHHHGDHGQAYRDRQVDDG